ncbi:DUF4440 domain-containing protein [Yinghuangia soli]|uniref:DUF4440 domain-containing protein n=1 Tax=Yinghuangia soli TaxID=2908204 RepID=A0AA41Q0B2_9ACTN|nr:DUF4440 domain-containing protein [Yinghuangia soli]MCF2528877.1 DUF4440 domain-containing protein [Yinghuangia soli]
MIEEWLTGAVARPDAGTPAAIEASSHAFAAFADVHDPAFDLIAPNGERLFLDAVLEAVRRAYGTAPALRLRISDVEVVASGGGVHVAVYREMHENGESAGAEVRRSTVVLVDAPHAPYAPHGLWWRHLHETWE